MVEAFLFQRQTACACMCGNIAGLGTRHPVVCLPGLARTTADFDALAPALADGHPPRRVIAIDSRGRGQSEYDADPQNYNPGIELTDVMTVLTGCRSAERSLWAARAAVFSPCCLQQPVPAAIAGVVLHDIGPVD